MSKQIIISLLILTIFSCQENKKTIQIGKELKGKTFDAINTHFKYPLSFDFRDSTYRVYGIDSKNRTFKITDSADALIDSEKSRISKSIDNLYDYLIVINNTDSLLLKQRKTKWESHMIYGNWVELKPDVTEMDSLPTYSISENQMNYKYLTKKLNSEIDINDTFEFINMSLEQSKTLTEINWRIINVSDSIMLIDKTYRDNGLNITTQYNIKLEKKH